MSIARKPITLKSPLLVFLAIACCVFGFLAAAGTLNSGYHFVDDHEILEISRDLETQPLHAVVQNWIEKDLTMRFRPMYYVHRVLESQLFGNNFVLWSIWTGILASTAFFFFYKGMRNLGFSRVETATFLTVLFIGQQMEIWWRLGPNETIAMAFLGISFYFLSKPKIFGTIDTVFFSLFLILASWSKEAFVLLVPAFILLKINNDKIVHQIDIKAAIKRNLITIVPLVVAIINVFLIVFVVGTNKIGYAGLDLSIMQYASGIISIIKESLLPYFAMILVITGLLYYEYKNEKRFGATMKGLLIPALFAALIIVPNLFLYAKTGISGRYFLPLLVGVAFLVVSMIRQARIDFPWMAKLLIAVVLLICVKPALTAFENAKSFAEDGRQTARLLASVADSNNDSKILIVADPVNNFELSHSLDIYLANRSKQKLFAYSVKESASGDFESGLFRIWQRRFDGRMLKDMNAEPDRIVFFDTGKIQRFFETSGLSIESYRKVTGSDDAYAVFQEVE